MKKEETIVTIAETTCGGNIYFSLPTDTLSNSISLILVLLAITNRQELNGYIELLVYAVCMFILSIFHMIVKNYHEKAKRVSFWCLKHLGSSKTMFSVVYLVAAFSFFRDNKVIDFSQYIEDNRGTNH